MGGDCKINDLIFSSADANGSNLMLINVYIYVWNLVDNFVLIQLNESYTIVICIKCTLVSFDMMGFRRSRKRIVIDRPGRKIKCDIYIERPILVRMLFKEYNYYTQAGFIIWLLTYTELSLSPKSEVYIIGVCNF